MKEFEVKINAQIIHAHYKWFTNLFTRYRLMLFILTLIIFTKCTKTTEAQMKQYIEFYYPTTGEALYEINFDWGAYSITTGAGNDDVLSADSEPYRGYITLRPFPANEKDYQKFPAYLITKEGDVWLSEFANEIPPYNERKEVISEKTDTGTSISTTTIKSPLEAVVDHFTNNPTKWKSYGKLKLKGDSYLLERTKQ